MLLLFAFIFVSSEAALTNENVHQFIDVLSSISTSKYSITMKNDGGTAEPFFFLTFKSKKEDSLKDVWVSEKLPKGIAKKALMMNVETEVPGIGSGSVAYKIYFASPLQPGAEITVEARVDITDDLKPVPDILEGLDSQYMRYEGSSYFYSPYKTKSMRATLALGSSDITSKKGFIDPVEYHGKRITMGPYKNVPPFSHNAVSVRFKNDRGFLVATQMEKLFYISQWRSISVKEEYHVINAAARHEGEWSRADHSTSSKSRYGTSISDVWANLPADADHVDYKDLIGNVTSSKLRKSRGGKTPLRVVFRYPMMGGWRNHFWITYEILLKNYVNSAGNEHIFELPLFPSLDIDLLCEDLNVRVLLPEGARSIQVIDHPSLDFTSAQSVERTTLTIIGRPTITMNFKMLRSKSKHVPTVRIKYRYNTGLVWVTPLFIAGVVFSIFAAFIVCLRNGLLAEEVDQYEKIKTS